MSPCTFLLLDGQKVKMDVHPDDIQALPISLDDGSIIFAVAGEDEEEKLISLQQSINEDNQVISLMQFRDESLAFASLIDQVLP